MKKTVLLAGALLALTFCVNGQVLNGGFEDWTTTGNYMEPNGYLTPNPMTAATSYPVQRSSDHFPTNVGSYSLRLENDISLLPTDGFGIALQNSSGSMNNGPGPGFPITGHPNSLTGYYKFEPQNGDTLMILIILYSNGFPVTANQFSSTVAQANWTSFSIDIPTYTSADSASILMAAYNAAGPPDQYWPHGNSVLYVDNLNFDALINGTNEIEAQSPIEVFPNPSAQNIVLNYTENNGVLLGASLYDDNGKMVVEKTFSKTTILDVSNLSHGNYLLKVTSGNTLISEQKVVVIH